MEAVNSSPVVVPTDPISPVRDDLVSDGEPSSPVLHKGHLEDGAPVRCELIIIENGHRCVNDARCSRV